MDYWIKEIEGIGPAYGEKLKKAGIHRTQQLLEHCASAQGRKSVAKQTGCTPSQLLKWADMADLMRISGIGKQFGELLKASGVDTIKELRTRRADHLTDTLREVNRKKKLTRANPGLSQVQRWIQAAKKMRPRITH